MIATVLGAVVVYLRWRGDVVFVSPEVLTKLQNQNTKLSEDLDEERERRRQHEKTTDERLRSMLHDLIALEQNHKKQKEELKETSRLLQLYRDNLDMLMEWVNQYTPALRKAGIEPPDIESMRFRGE